MRPNFLEWFKVPSSTVWICSDLISSRRYLLLVQASLTFCQGEFLLKVLPFCFIENFTRLSSTTWKILLENNLQLILHGFVVEYFYHKLIFRRRIRRNNR